MIFDCAGAGRTTHVTKPSIPGLRARLLSCSPEKRFPLFITQQLGPMPIPDMPWLDIPSMPDIIPIGPPFIPLPIIPMPCIEPRGMPLIGFIACPQQATSQCAAPYSVGWVFASRFSYEPVPCFRPAAERVAGRPSLVCSMPSRLEFFTQISENRLFRLAAGE
jgi:hypothetical protein